MRTCYTRFYMKKYYYVLVVMLMALVSVGFAGCGDDEPEVSDIVGTWQVDNLDHYADVVTLLQFTRDGIFNEVDKYIDNGDTKADVYHGKYTVSGNKLTVTYIFINESETVDYTYQVEGDKLTLRDGDFYSTLTRVADSVIKAFL